MRLHFRPLVIALALSSSASMGCGKSPETPAAPSPASPAPAAPTPPGTTAEAGPGSAGAAVNPAPSAIPHDETFAVATFGDGRKVTSDDVRSALKSLQSQEPLDYRIVHELVEDLVDNQLLAGEARKAHFLPDGVDPDDDRRLGEAWARENFLAKARESVTDAELQAWFAERRGVARIWVRTEAQARELRTSLMESFDNAPERARELFLELKRKVGGRRDPVPDGVLVDREGRNETGDALVPAEIASAVFELDADSQVSEPVKSGSGFALVQRVGSRPATPIEKVPPQELEAAREKIAARRAMQLVDEHAMRLRLEAKVLIDEPAVIKLAHRLGASGGEFRKMPLGMRKMQLDRLRNDLHGVREARDPSLVPANAPGPDKKTYEKVREKMNTKPRQQRESTP